MIHYHNLKGKLVFKSIKDNKCVVRILPPKHKVPIELTAYEPFPVNLEKLKVNTDVDVEFRIKGKPWNGKTLVFLDLTKIITKKNTYKIMYRGDIIYSVEETDVDKVLKNIKILH